jgi:nucleotide-binding universal stress UspA family protein
MSGPIERVVVTLDAASESRTAIDTAVRLAARTGVPLHGLFVEDQDLLCLAGLPFACQVTIGRGAEKLSSEGIALQLRAEAERERRELASAAKRHRVECTFEIVRGEIIHDANGRRTAGASERDLVVAGGLARPVAGHFRIGPGWRPSLRTAAAPVLLARTLWTAPGPVVMLLRDRDAAAARLFDTAARIAAAKDSALAVLYAPPLADAAGMENWIAERTGAHSVRVRVEAAPVEPAALHERLGQLACRVIALDAGMFEGKDGLSELVERFACDMLVVP